MKHFYILVLFCTGILPACAQTLFTYGGHAVSKDEFLKAYNKNKTPVSDKAASLREYLELYSRFKLKVKTAELQRLDTLQQLQYDLQNFRSQVAEGYMNDEKGLNALVDEAIVRAQKDIHVIHYSVSTSDTLQNADTAQLYSVMNELYTVLSSGKTGNEEAIKGIREKYPFIKQKDLGYITVFSLPYLVENKVYALELGEMTTVMRTKTGLHIFKHAGERQSAGKWKVAQILISTPQDASVEELKAASKKADSIYNLLMNGAGFATLAKQFSDDKLTYLNGGEMPEFGTGKFELPFESKVFELQKDGEVSKPFSSSYGFHIVKRIQHKTLPAGKSDEEYVSTLKQAVLQDSRMDASRANFAKQIKTRSGYKVNPAVKENDLFRYADSVSINGVVKKYPINNKIIFSFVKSPVKGEEWLNFIKDYKLNKDVYKGESNKELFEKFTSTSSFDYYRKHLEEYNDDFKSQMQEFKEGNMLFEIMERNVWTKATNDSLGLLKYYKDHQSKYLWSESAAVLIFNCVDSSVAQAAITAIKNDKDWKQVSADSEGQIQADSGRYELAQLQLPLNVDIREGQVIPQEPNTGDNTSGFVKVLKLFPANQQRSFEEARGMVINDYQGFLDERWITELKNRYPIVVNEAVFREILSAK